MKTLYSLISTSVLFLISTDLPAAITGQWDFNSGNLSATIGSPLTFLDAATESGTEFNTTTAFGISNIGGQAASVMKFPKMANSAMGYLLTHGAAPNGGGGNVNQYTIIMDVYYPAASSSRWRSLTQTDNSGDGDFFLNPGNGVGISGSYAGNVTGDAWHRIILAVDVSANPPVVSKFVDGVKAADQILGSGLDSRWSLPPTIYLLNDEDGESEIGYINSLQVRDNKISDALAAILGAPTASGIPTTDLPAHPYLESTVPVNGATGVAADTVISAAISDGEQSVIENSITLSLNGGSIIPVISKQGTITTVTHQPSSPFSPGSTNTVRLVFADNSGRFTNDWVFVVKPLAQPPAITGQWDFDQSDLRATLGLPLEYFDGPAGTTQAQTQFGTTTSFGLPDINGIPANVLRFPGATSQQIGYTLRHGAVPNGEGSKVNQWTLIMDILIPHSDGQQWFSFIQTDDLANGGDGDLFANFSGESAGIGIGGSYGGANSIVASAWHRVAFAVDMSGPSPVITKFIDGVKHSDQSRTAPQLDARHALHPFAILFADDDGESQPAFVNSIQFRNYKMGDVELAKLGGPSADGIPLVAGQWDFDAADLTGSIGGNMQPRNNDLFFTTFETTQIDSLDANIMSFGGITSDDGYVFPIGILPNGGGTFVNQYTLILDIMFPSGSTGFRALLQTETNNTSDADLFVNGSNGIGISSLYHGNLVPDTWHRVAFTVDLTKRELGKFVNGSNVLSGPVGSTPGTGPYQYLSTGVDGRFSLDKAALLFADDDGELAAGSVNSIQLRLGALTPQQIAALGGPTASGIPVNIPAPPKLAIAVDFDTLLISWPASYTDYVLEGSENLGAAASWQPVPDVLNNSVSVFPTGNRKFFRLRKL